MSDLVYQMYKHTKNLIKRSLDCEKGCEHEGEPLFQEWETTVDVLELANPDYRLRYESECGIRPGKEEIAFMELKGQICKLMFDFVDKYSGQDNPESLYPKTGYIMVDVLTACLNEAQYQVTRYHPFTERQKNHICYQIGDWYVHVKSLLEGTHNLGYQKEMLKIMICGSDND